MQSAEQESLLLRQMAALRRSGLSQDQALVHAADGLPRGPLAVRVAAARRVLESGAQSNADPLLSNGTTPVAALDHAAGALDARLSADAALAMTRLYATIALAGPLALGGVLAWVTPDLMSIVGEAPNAWVVLMTVFGALRFLGIPLAIGVSLLIGHGGERLAPGVSRIRQAAALLQAAAADQDPLKIISNPTDMAYFSIRRAQVGVAQSAAELAGELVQEGEHAASLFRHLAPPAAAVLGVFILIPALLLFGFPLFSLASM